MTSAARLVAIVVGAYLVVRGLVEPFAIDYGDPASYAEDWGGPSLVGVLAVHSGPALLLLGWLGHRAVSGKLGTR